MNRIKRKGSSMLLTIAIFGILSIVGTSMLAVTTANYKMRIDENNRVQNLYSAESGLDLAYVELVQQVDEAISIGKANSKKDSGKSFREEYDAYIINELPSKVGKEYNLSGTSYKAKVDCSVSVKDKNTKVATLTSTYTSDGKERIISVNYDIATPTITSSDIPGEMSGIVKYSLATDKNMVIKNGSDVDIYGDAWIQGSMPQRDMAITLAQKYNGGLEVVNSKAEAKGSIATASNIKIINSDMTVKSDNVYAENIYIGEGESLKGKFNAGNSDIYMANDLVIDNKVAGFKARRYYGFNDVNSTANIVESNLMNEMVRGSSSIIINSEEWPYGDAEIKIGDGDDEDSVAYIMGAAYINTETPYQTGESVAVKGNYEAYTAPLNGEYDKSQYRYFNPLVLLTKQWDEESKSYKDMGIQDKAEHFVDYAGDNSNVVRKTKISLPENTYAAGAYISENNVDWKIPEPSDNTPASAKNEFVKEVYYMGKDKVDSIYGDDEFNRTVVEYKDELNRVPLYTVNGQVNWSKVNEIIKSNSNAAGKYEPFNDAGLVVILSEDTSGTIEITQQGNGKKLSVSIPGHNSNHAVEADSKFLIVTKGNVKLAGIEKLDGTIFSIGNIEINNCKGTVGTSDSLIDAINNSSIIKDIFSESSISNGEINAGAQQLISKGKWILEK